VNAGAVAKFGRTAPIGAFYNYVDSSPLLGADFARTTF